VTMTTTRGERILVIEDEPDILEIMEYNLRREGFRVTGARDGVEGLDKVKAEFPDVILLDLMLPGLDGLELCRSLKRDPTLRSIPVIMVTAKGEIDDVVKGLEAGADDYISKPFSPKELVARVKAVARRGTWDDSQPRERIAMEGVMIDSAAHEVRISGEPVAFTATEFRLLHYLASHPGRVYTRDHLLDRVMGGDKSVIDRNIDVHVGAIRRKLADHRQVIETVRGVGYRFRPA